MKGPFAFVRYVNACLLMHILSLVNMRCIRWNEWVSEAQKHPNYQTCVNVCGNTPQMTMAHCYAFQCIWVVLVHWDAFQNEWHHKVSVLCTMCIAATCRCKPAPRMFQFCIITTVQFIIIFRFCVGWYVQITTCWYLRTWHGVLRMWHMIVPKNDGA